MSELLSTALRYLPHQPNAEVLRMGLSPLVRTHWIETDAGIGDYHRHKLAQRTRLGDAVYRATPESLPAQRELAQLLRDYLCSVQARHYRLDGDTLHCTPGGFSTPADGDELLWLSSLWIADDLVIMQPQDDAYVLTAASLCSPSHWRLAEKFGKPMHEIHDPIPGFHQRLTPSIDRFFARLDPAQAYERFNWSLQVGDELLQFPDEHVRVDEDAELFYRVERQSLTRLPESGAIVFTIRVYLHPLEDLLPLEGALRTLLRAVEQTPPALANYKGFDRLAPALQRYYSMAGFSRGS
ncbi:DUF3445 domain-containing protein [Mangrovimicrobium sediminis]|uniref:DUF3445 domain-containing protein n=1 Tax=Mangrovimicrobium sediminis TaxID=2562682 RepID=A0A4Z0M2S0_9GAMM|nr:DUF3445 domain-containing protein [Haliea sp. SAOS-164]TGD73902.1 DUF3445 domain-containing protein [Haliea sp. SAOS-164]